MNTYPYDIINTKITLFVYNDFHDEIVKRQLITMYPFF